MRSLYAGVNEGVYKHRIVKIFPLLFLRDGGDKFRKLIRPSDIRTRQRVSVARACPVGIDDLSIKTRKNIFERFFFCRACRRLCGRNIFLGRLLNRSFSESFVGFGTVRTQKPAQNVKPDYDKDEYYLSHQIFSSHTFISESKKISGRIS